MTDSMTNEDVVDLLRAAMQEVVHKHLSEVMERCTAKWEAEKVWTPEASDAADRPHIRQEGIA